MVFVQCFIGTCVWLLLSEIFPMTIRGFAMGIAVFVLWTINAAISFAFPIVDSALGSTGTFGIFVLINIVSIFFVTKFVPETQGPTAWRRSRTTSARTTPRTWCTRRRPRPAREPADSGRAPTPRKRGYDDPARPR